MQDNVQLPCSPQACLAIASIACKMPQRLLSVILTMQGMLGGCKLCHQKAAQPPSDRGAGCLIGSDRDVAACTQIPVYSQTPTAMLCASSAAVQMRKRMHRAEAKSEHSLSDVRRMLYMGLSEVCSGCACSSLACPAAACTMLSPLGSMLAETLLTTLCLLQRLQPAARGWQ